MENENINKWESAAWDLESPLDKLPVPFHILAGEALDVARFGQRHWEPTVDRNGKEVLPGLASAATEGRFSAAIVTEILELADALQAVHSRYRLLVDAPGAAPVERAQFIIGEMRDVLQWYADDGREDEFDAQLDRLASVHDNAASHDALAAALHDYAALADRHRAAIDSLGGFDAQVIDEAREIATALRERSAGPATLEPSPGQRQALDLRNRVATLLYARMQRVRSAARFVFRRHPDLVRQATSAYARQQRANYRRRQRDDVAKTADTVDTMDTMDTVEAATLDGAASA